jgi:hypothetical protein
MMVEPVHLRSVITNTNVIDKIQQLQQEQQDQNLRHAIKQDNKNFADKREAVNLAAKLENKIIIHDESKQQGSKSGQKQEETNEEPKPEIEKTTEEKTEGTIIDIRI